MLTICFYQLSEASTSFNTALARAVEGDRVNYQVLCQDNDFKRFLNEIPQTDPLLIEKSEDRLAFWINVYNAYNLEIVCKHYPIRNLNQLHKGGLVWAALRGKTIWDNSVNVGGKSYTLKNIEHAIIKKQFNEPLSQFALSCGSIFCPSVRNEIYQGGRLKEQLEDQARIFFANPTLNSFDVGQRRAVISPIMNWNLKSFGRNTQEMLVFISAYMPDLVRDDLMNNTKLWKISYSTYDLVVNDINLNKEK